MLEDAQVRILKHIVAAIVYSVLGALVLGLLFYLHLLEGRPPLEPWHTAKLDEEFRASRADKVKDLAGYLQLEERLFDQLQREVYEKTTESHRNELLRYDSGSMADPNGYQRNWNRTFEHPVDKPRAGVLLLHGLTDSPYSLQALAGILHRHGAWVLGLRMPGHGTAPAGLTRVKWQDYAASIRIGAKHVAEAVGSDTPFFIVGYSNGAALTVEYALSVLDGEDLPAPDGIVLLSPAIGVTRAAALAIWLERLSKVPGLKPLAWQHISPEYDPFKYNSFPIRAGDQMYALTQEIASRVDSLDDGSGVKGFPPALVFQSLVDATVIPAALVDRLMRRLSPGHHELVIFDVNRLSEAAPFLRADKESLRDVLLADDTLPFTFTLITNTSEQSRDVKARRKLPRSKAAVDEPLELAWPRGIYSLAHIALPFPPDDPVYGYAASPGKGGVHLGRVDLRGERGLLLVSAANLTRLHANPFFPYMVERILVFLRLSGDSD